MKKNEARESIACRTYSQFEQDGNGLVLIFSLWQGVE
jgi:hypothetical protein